MPRISTNFGDRLFSGFPVWDFLVIMAVQFICAFGIVYFTTVYKENPPVITTCICILVLIILFFGVRLFVIYPEKIVFTATDFISVIFRLKQKVYLIKDIKRAYLQQIIKKGEGEVVGLVMLEAFLPDSERNNMNESFINDKVVFLDLKNGTTIQLQTNYGINKAQRMVTIINNLIKNSS